MRSSSALLGKHGNPCPEVSCYVGTGAHVRCVTELDYIYIPVDVAIFIWLCSIICCIDFYVVCTGGGGGTGRRDPFTGDTRALRCVMTKSM